MYVGQSYLPPKCWSIISDTHVTVVILRDYFKTIISTCINWSVSVSDVRDYPSVSGLAIPAELNSHSGMFVSL